MSSHHVIRDEQEPPIIILTERFNQEFVHELLGWSPLLIVSEKVFPLFDVQNIKVDFVIGTEKTEVGKYFSPKFLNVKNLEHLNYPKLTLLLQGKSFTGVNVFCSSAIKANLIESIMADKIELEMPISVFVEEEKTILISRKKYVKWYPAGQRLLYDPDIISITPSLSAGDGYYSVNKAGKYEFIANNNLLIITELYP